MERNVMAATTPTISTRQSGSASRAQPPPPVSHRSLDGPLVRGLAWTGTMKWLGQAAAWAATLVVMRLLTPSDYGLVGMAAVYLGIVTLLSEFGLGAAVVMMRDLDEGQIAQINTFSILAGLGGFAISCLAAVPLGRFFGAPQLPPVVVAMSTVFIITSFSVVPTSLLQRDLRFKELAVIDGAQAVILAGAMVVLALLGFRYWTLVLGSLLGAAFTTAVALRLRPVRFARPRLRSVRRALGYSGNIVASRLAYYAYTNADFVTVGKVLGKDALGFYTVAWSLASVPIDKISSLVVRVTPAFFSAVQNDRPSMRRYLLVLTEGLALVTFPLTIGLGLVSRDFVLTLIGAKWEPAILPLQLLALYASFRSITPLLTPILNVTGDEAFAARNGLLAMLILPVGFIFGCRWGTAGVAAAWILLHPPVVARLYHRVALRIGLSSRDYLAALWPAISGVLIMTVAVLAVRATTPASFHPIIRLALQVTAGAIAYLGVAMIFHRDRVRSLRRILRLVRSTEV